MKLNIGCGRKKIEDYINCDISRSVNPDIILDLEKPLPFIDNSVDEIVLSHVLEHVNNFISLMHQLWRISTKNAKIKICVPFYSSLYAFIDPTHVRFFTPFSFNYFKGNNECSHEVKSDKDLFDIYVRIDYATLS